MEVVPPNDRHSEVIEKVLEWLDAGCRMVLVVNPKQHTVTVYRSREDIRILADGDTLVGDGVIPGLSIPVAEIFA